MSTLLQLLRDEEAVTSVEYAVMVSMILMAAIVAIAAFGSTTSDKFTTIDQEMKGHGLK